MTYKIVDYLDGDNQYNFTFPSGWQPLDESQMPAVNLEDQTPIPFMTLSFLNNYGVSARPITLAGRDIADNDRYVLSSCISNTRLKKLYLEDDWFYYVLGVEPRTMRTEQMPLTFNYTAAFMAADPCMYFCGTSDGDYPTGTSGFGYNTGSQNGDDVDFTLDLGSKGSWFVEPILWIQNENGNAITFTDSRGCSLTFTPPTNDTWTIFPYRNHYTNGFFCPDYPIAYKNLTTDLTDLASFYAFDASPYTHPFLFAKTTGNYSSTITLSDGNSIGYQNKYPRFIWDKSSTVIASKTGTLSASNIAIQYRYRRM